MSSSIFGFPSPPDPDVTGTDILRFGEIPIHESEATNHFLVAGATGSGKTTVLRLLLQSFIPQIHEPRDCRAIVTNPKQDMLPILRGMAHDVEIITLDPFDRRGYRWDAQKDICDVRTAVQFLYTLFPEVKGSQPFFENAVRHIGYGVVISFMLSEVRWTLADMLRVLRSEDYIRSVLQKHVYTAPIYDQYFADPKLAYHVIASIGSRLLPFEPIAAAWDTATDSISLLEWSKRPCVLVLPHSEISRAATDTINRCLFKRASDVTLDQPDSFSRRTWFVFDEISDSPKFDGLVSLLKKGRSKGACVALAFQSISGLRQHEKYGTEFTDEILGQIGNRFFGRLECPATAEWASKLIGDQEVEGISRSETFGADSRSSSENRQMQMRRAVLPAEFMMIEPCGIDTGLTGFFLTRSGGAFFSKLDAEELFCERLRPRADEPDIVPRPSEAQFLHIWTPEEASRFGAVSQALTEASQSKDHVLGQDEIDQLLQ